MPAPERIDQLCDYRIDLAFFIRGGAQRRAVVEVRPAIPLAVPAVLLNISPQSAGFDRVPVREHHVAAPPRQVGELREHMKQEERQPHALAPALLADKVHAVIPVAAPHERQSVAAKAQTVFECADSVLVERADVIRHLRQVVVRFLVVPQGARSQEGDALLQYSSVTGYADIAANGQGQPEVVVGEVRSHAAPNGRMPPVLHITFAKLAGCGAQQVLAEQLRLGMHQGHRVLELVAETERAARLIESGAGPHAAGQCLINEPAVGQEIDRRVGRFHIDHAERPAPVVPHALDRPMGAVNAAELLRKVLGFRGPARAFRS